MQVKAQVKSRFDGKEVKRKIDAAKFKSLEHAAASIRLTALRSVRKGRKQKERRSPAKPGAPPKTWDNRTGRMMKRNILYSKPVPFQWRMKASVYASPEKAGDRVFQMHEYGGSQTIETFTNIVDDRTYRRSGHWKWKRDHYIPMNERSAKQQAAIRDYYDNVVNIKKKIVRKTARYAKRPFLDPAVKKNMYRIRATFRANIQQQLH